MSADVTASRTGSQGSISVGEKVTLGESATEYVVVSVDHASGRLELLRQNPGRIESDVPSSSVRKTNQAGPLSVLKRPATSTEN